MGSDPLAPTQSKEASHVEGLTPTRRPLRQPGISMLEVTGLSVRYGKHLALDGVSLSVGPGEIVVMLGANGAGKSSCLKALGGMVARMPGARIALGGVDLTRLPAHEIVEAGLALVPEDRGIFA